MHVPTLTSAELLVRLAVALVLGTLVGGERERGERAAGMRTFALVCFGSALITIVSAYGFTDFTVNGSYRMDPGRIAAQIVSGIGFLGAGTIIFRREIVQGLTTAAGLWVVAGIGMAVGAGLYLAGVVGAAGAMVILAVLKQVERRFFPHHRYLTIQLRRGAAPVSDIRAACVRSGVRLDSLILRVGDDGDEVKLKCGPADETRMDRLVEQLRDIAGVLSIETAPAGTLEQEEDAGRVIGNQR